MCECVRKEGIIRAGIGWIKICPGKEGGVVLNDDDVAKFGEVVGTMGWYGQLVGDECNFGSITISRNCNFQACSLRSFPPSPLNFY